MSLNYLQSALFKESVLHHKSRLDKQSALHNNSILDNELVVHNKSVCNIMHKWPPFHYNTFNFFWFYAWVVNCGWRRGTLVRLCGSHFVS